MPGFSYWHNLSFDSGTRTVTSATGAVDFSDFISQRNDGTYTLEAEPTATVLALEEQIFDEDGPTTGVLISSVVVPIFPFLPRAVLTIYLQI